MSKENLEELWEVLSSLDEKELEMLAKKDNEERNTVYNDWEETFHIKDEDIEEKEDNLELKKGDLVVYNDVEGVVIEELPNGKFIVNMDGKNFIFASVSLRKADLQPGVIVKPKNSTEDKEYVVSEIDPVTNKVKVKDKNTNEEFYMDKNSIEIKTAADFPYNKSDIEEGTQKNVEDDKVKSGGDTDVVEKDKEDFDKKETKTEENVSPEPEVKEDKEVLLTDTIKSILKEPEIAKQIVEKLIDIITTYGLEKEFLKGVSKASVASVDVEDNMEIKFYLRKLDASINLDKIKSASIFVAFEKLLPKTFDYIVKDVRR